jgi:hypothetical protein
VQVPNLNDDPLGAVEISAGGFGACARLGSGKVRCWGDNYNGEVGDGIGYPRYVPTDVAF